jgi:hypothetical protein
MKLQAAKSCQKSAFSEFSFRILRTLGAAKHYERKQFYDSSKFQANKLRHTNSAYAHRNTGWLFYPCFEEDHILIRPGETVKVNCGVELVSADNYALTMYACPDLVSPLIIHPSVISGGEAVTIRLTNASHQVCIIAKENFDIASRRGHGIFRSAVVIPYGQPAARGMLTLCGTACAPDCLTGTGAEGMCAL